MEQKHGNLILSRNIGERIIINDGEYCITLYSIKGNQAKISIQGPRDVAIHREEIWLRIRKEGKKKKELKNG